MVEAWSTHIYFCRLRAGRGAQFCHRVSSLCRYFADKWARRDLRAGSAGRASRRLTFDLYKEVAILRTIPGTQLRAGDVGVLVAIPEVFAASGESIAVVTVLCAAVAPLRADQVPAVRRLATASPGGSESTPLLAMANTP